MVLEHRPLFDVRLEIGADRVIAWLLVAEVADSFEFVANALAIDVARGVGVFQREIVAEDARSHHHRDEARAFLVGPEGDFERRLGFYAVVVERSHHLDPGENAEVAVEFAAGRLRVDVAAHHHRRQLGVASGAAHEDVADLVDGDRKSGVARPGDDEVAALAVEVGERETADAALGRRADARELHQRIPEAFAVDADVFDGGHERLPVQWVRVRARRISDRSLPVGPISDRPSGAPRREASGRLTCGKRASPARLSRLSELLR